MEVIALLSYMSQMELKVQIDRPRISKHAVIHRTVEVWLTETGKHQNLYYMGKIQLHLQKFCNDMNEDVYIHVLGNFRSCCIWFKVNNKSLSFKRTEKSSYTRAITLLINIWMKQLLSFTILICIFNQNCECFILKQFQGSYLMLAKQRLTYSCV